MFSGRPTASECRSGGQRRRRFLGRNCRRRRFLAATGLRRRRHRRRAGEYDDEQPHRSAQHSIASGGQLFYRPFRGVFFGTIIDLLGCACDNLYLSTGSLVHSSTHDNICFATKLTLHSNTNCNVVLATCCICGARVDYLCRSSDQYSCPCWRVCHHDYGISYKTAGLCCGIFSGRCTCAIRLLRGRNAEYF